MALRTESALRLEPARSDREGVVLGFPADAARRRARRARMLARRRRSVGILVAVMGAAGLWSSGPDAAPPAREAARDPSAVVVRSGETVWDLANRFGPRGSDRRAYVDAIEQANDIEAPLRAGTRLRLPE